MQDKIETLLRAYLEETNRENEFIAEVLGSLAKGVAQRRQMIDEIAAAAEKITASRDEVTAAPPPKLGPSLERAIQKLRDAGGVNGTDTAH
ncbi:MAG: hypothetical protein RLZ98_1100 [Pseudomonadota bacterium]|jgi:hypothetical protein